MKKMIRGSGMAPVLAGTFVLSLGFGFSDAGKALAASATESGFFVPGTIHRSNGGPLHAPNGAGMPAAVADFLSTRGHSAATTDSLRVKREMAIGNTGATVIELTQEVQGLAVHGVRVRASFNADGDLTSMSENVVAAGSVIPAVISTRTALDAALAGLHPGFGFSLSEDGRSDNAVTFGGDNFFYRDPTVTRVAIPMPGNVLREGYLVETWSDDDNQLNHTLVGGNGQILDVQNRTANDSYNVFTEHPGVSSQTIIDGPVPGTPSLFGWLDGGEQTKIDIFGNNVHAYLDRNNDDGADAGGDPVSDGNFDSSSCLDAEPLDVGNSCSTGGGAYDNQAVAVQNLFYLNNVIHDELYRAGFTESAANFQEDNSGIGGAESDSVDAEAQDGGGKNNANFATTLDGYNPRMQMYLWDWTSPGRDGDLDGDIVWHEYGHGLSWRVVGSMGGNMSGSIGEGASDALALVFYNDDMLGEYATGMLDRGIRSNRYDTYLEDTGRTYESIAASWGDVHYNGEVYAAIIWDMWKRNRLDSCPASTNSTDPNSDNCVADVRDLTMGDMVQGMIATKYSDPWPSFPSFRDGILEALSGSADPEVAPVDAVLKSRWCNTWAGFAKYGVGVSQVTTFFINSWSWTEDFDTPAVCDVTGDPPVAGFSASLSGLTVAFTDTSTDSDGNIVSWAWSFGDGNTSTAQNPSHTYVADGTYTVELTVTDNDGNTDSTSNSVTVNAPSAVVADAGGNYAVQLPKGRNATASITLDGSGSTGNNITYLWSGTTGTIDNPDTDKTQVSGLPRGTHTFILRVDGASGFDTATACVEVHKGKNPEGLCSPPGPTPPVASFSNSCVDLACTFDGSGSSDSDGTIVSYAWTFGDGANGLSSNVSHTYASNGTYLVTLTVTDNDGSTNSTSQDITVPILPSSLGLSASGRKVRGLHKVDLTWTGADIVNIYRDGNLEISGADDSIDNDGGTATDNVDLKGGATYSYQVCDAGNSAACSNTVTVVF